ncbi:hypothetical protein C1645_834251 [Glomus cerebriforme]|uniref:Uncharacterized protein n=1 Tax=Glomus cerebriforme TaxID=658196 RepID=A0A397S9X4_9GLOM|nr:hypothetical protein C1645_834251 [Glomus cerebriforme]
MKWSKIIDNNEREILKIDVNDNDIERNLSLMLIIIGLTVENNEKIIIETSEAKEIYNIIEKMVKIKEKGTMRRKWKIRNINYIKRILDITEKRKIFWSLVEIKKERKGIIKENYNEIDCEIVDINELEETIPMNRYRLHWNRKVVNDHIRETVKKYNKFKYLGEWLTLKINKNILNNIGKKEVDWEKTIEYIKNKNEGGSIITSDKDMRDRIYNIKNLIEQLPTYTIMSRRNKEIYDMKCPRCKKEDETWLHIWQCEKNEYKINDIIQDEIHNQIEALQKENIILIEINGIIEL